MCHISSLLGSEGVACCLGEGVAMVTSGSRILRKPCGVARTELLTDGGAIREYNGIVRIPEHLYNYIILYLL